jgi:uncharacterized membrane protein HdeD (DUF308 family)
MQMTTITDDSALNEQTRSPLRVAGYIAIALGVLALISPFLAGLVVTLVLGANFFVGGILEAVAAFKAERWSGTIGLLLLAIVSIVAGLVIFAHPLLGLTTLTLVAILSLLVAGLAKIFWAFKVADGRWYLVLSGILSILVAGMLYTNFPLSAAWALGVLIGINLIVEGVTLLAFVRSTE